MENINMNDIAMVIGMQVLATMNAKAETAKIKQELESEILELKSKISAYESPAPDRP